MSRHGVVAAGLALLLSGCRTASTPARLPDGPGGPLLVLAAPDASVWVQLLRASGASARVGTLDEMLARRAGVITPGAQLVAEQAAALRRWVSRGARVVTAHAGTIEALGFSRGEPLAVGEATTDGVAARWPRPEPVRPLQAGPPLADVRVHTAVGHAALVASARLGRGGVLGVATDPIGRGEVGYERFPGLGRLMASWTGAPRGPARIAAELYVDPTVSAGTPADLAGRLAGARAVHVAGWYLDAADPSLDYPYGALVDALHAQGVLAYAWIEPPFVGGRLWDDHPECRERTASGADAVAGGRRLIALEEPSCMDLAWATWERLVTSFPWDGVNVAGLHFEADEPAGAETPYHPAALGRFGRDPRADAGGFRRYRTDLVVELNESVLRRLNGLPGASEMAFALTTAGGDGASAPDAAIGTDPVRLAAVAAAQGAALHVGGGDAAAEGPQRYNRMAPAVAALMPPGQGLVDVAAGPPGAESDLTAMAASQSSGRVAVDAATSLAPGDVDHLALALGANVQVFDSGVRAPATVTVSAPGGPAWGRLLLDGQPWPAARGSAVVPGGDHQLVWGRGGPDGPSLVRLTGELGTAAIHGRAMTFSYDSRPPALAVVEPRPVELLVDDAPAPASSVERPSGGFVVRLPPGTHRVEMRFGAER